MKTRTMALVLLSLGWLAPLALPLAACSSKDSGVQCGDGTVLKDGMCVAAAASPQEQTPPPAPPGLPPGCAEMKEYLSKCDKASAANKAAAAADFQKMEAIIAALPPADREANIAKFDKSCRDSMPTTRKYCETGNLPAAAPEVAKLKDTVKFPHAEWVVLSAIDKGRHLPSNNDLFKKSLNVDEGKFVLVQFKVRNLTNDKATTRPPKLKDGRGRVFDHLEEHDFFIPEDKKTLGFFEKIPPSIASEFWEVFQIADDSTDLLLLTHDLDGGEMKPVALGI